MRWGTPRGMVWGGGTAGGMVGGGGGGNSQRVAEFTFSLTNGCRTNIFSEKMFAGVPFFDNVL